MADRIGQVTRMRLLLASVGAGAGLAFYLLEDVVDSTIIEPRLHLFLFTMTAVLFGAWMAMAGPLRVGRAGACAAALSVPLAGLVTWASTRFSDPSHIFHAPESVLAAFLLAALPLPYMIAAQTPGVTWRDYPTLFTESWGIVVRYAAAWLFVAVIWVVVMLSNSLLQLVGLSIIRDLLEIDAVPYILTGVGLGLTLAVVNELSDYVSPFLVLRLLRLLLPAVTLVVGLFLLALPLRGLSGLFGQFSVSATLLAMAVAAATLVSTALDQTDAEAVRSRAMILSVELLALMLPVLAALSGWAMWLRIDQYGLSPARIAGALGAALVLAYGILYAVSVLLRGAWMDRIRQGNALMALVVLALAFLWLTPLFNAEAISARNQIARYRSGKTPTEMLDLDELQNRLGRAGADAMEELKTLAGNKDKWFLRYRLTQFENQPVAGDQTTLNAADASRLRTQLRLIVPVRPKGKRPAIFDDALKSVSPEELQAWLSACNRRLPDGRPGCVLVRGDFLPDSPGEEALLLYRDPAGFLRIDAFSAASGGDGVARPGTTEMAKPGVGHQSAAATLAQILDGDFTVGPTALNALRLPQHQVLMLP